MDKRRLPKTDLREIPTAEDILAGCREVQARWTPEVERMRRTGTSIPEGLMVPVIKEAEMVNST